MNDLERKLKFLTGNDEYSEQEIYQPDENSHFINIESQEENNDSDGEITLRDLSAESYLRLDHSKKSSKKDKKKRSEYFDDFDDDDLVDSSYLANERGLKKLKGSKIYNKITKHMSADLIDDFEGFLNSDDTFSGEDSDELRSNLISMGRTYARDTGVSAENSEIVKVFSTSEKKLKDLYDEISKDSAALQKDIDQMRNSTRGKNFKTLSEMAATKTTYHNTKLAAIKEMNSIKKTQFDMQMKEKAAKLASGSGDASSDISSSTIKSLFGAGRNDIVNSIGGYGRVSGARGNSIGYQTLDLDEDDEAIEQKYFANDAEEVSDGDKFLEYENSGVEYVLLVDDDAKPLEVIAEDRDGNVIPDYPMPSNVDQLRFDVNMFTLNATDELHRKYNVRKV